MEEASEIQKACSKALRFGLDSNNQGKNPTTNADDIVYEYFELKALIERAADNGILKHLQLDEKIKIMHNKNVRYNNALIDSHKIGTVIPEQ